MRPLGGTCGPRLTPTPYRTHRGDLYLHEPIGFGSSAVEKDITTTAGPLTMEFGVQMSTVHSASHSRNELIFLKNYRMSADVDISATGGDLIILGSEPASDIVAQSPGSFKAMDESFLPGHSNSNRFISGLWIMT